MQIVSATDAKQALLLRLNIEEFQNFRDEVGSKAKKHGLTKNKLDSLLDDKQ